MAKHLRILHWIARGLKRKVAPLRLLLKEQEIDVALISETFLGPADKIKFSGYTIYRPNARLYQGGIRFLPESEGEYRVVQRYLTLLEKENGISWFAYSLPAERRFKVAIRGLPADTDPADIEEELRRLEYEPEFVRNI